MGTHASCYIDGTLCFTQLTALMLQEARDVSTVDLGVGQHGRYRLTLHTLPEQSTDTEK